MAPGLLAMAAVVRAEAQQATDRELAAHPGAVFADCADCPTLVVVPSGTFAMGSRADDPVRDASEGPRHRVAIERPLALERVEVTVAQFRAFVRDTGEACDVWRDGQWSERPGYSWRVPGFPQGNDHPAACLSWDDAQAYLAWLGHRTGKPYRLPTEAEWEHAALAGAATRFPFGDLVEDYCRHGNGADRRAQALVPGATAWTVLACDDGHPYTAPVGSFAPSRFGLHDMLGNVFEWVEDCWHDDYESAPADGTAWTSGGAWGYPPDYLRTAVRGRQPQGYRYVNAGLRDRQDGRLLRATSGVTTKEPTGRDPQEVRNQFCGEYVLPEPVDRDTLSSWRDYYR